MNCPKCNAQVNDRFCPECGYDTSNKKQCPVCQSEIAGRFCEKCGYDSEKSAEPKKKESIFSKAKAWVKSHKGVCIAGVLAIMLVIGLIPVIAYFSSIYRVGVVSQVTVGMEKAQVEAILGAPTEDKDYKWVYFNSDALSELEELDAEMEEAFLSGDDEKLLELAEEYDEKCAELESETFEYIEIYFDSEGKVESVLLDTEKSYADEVEPKALKQVQLDLDSNSIEVRELIIEDKIECRLPDSFPSKAVYRAEYEDGSWYSGYVNKSELVVEINDSDDLLTWYDYSGNVKCSITIYAEMAMEGRIEDGVLYYWPSEEGVLNIPNGVNEIASEAFDDRTDLISVTIPNSVTSIGDHAFAGCTSLVSVAIGDSVTSIGEDAFHGCTGLTSITIPDSVTSIGEDAFYKCYKLVEVYNLSSPESLSNTMLSSYALNIYTSLEEKSKLFTTDDGFVFYDDGKTRYLLGYKGDKTEITLPSNCNGYDYEIYKYAFSKCKNITSITIPESVTSIGEYAFSGCTSLTSVTFENTEGWKRGGIIIDVTDPSKNAENLTSRYYQYTWTREQ